MGILGPAQPYLAQIVGVLNEEINFIWTGRGVGSCLAAVMTGLVFKSLLRQKWQKLSFLGTFILCAGVFVGLVPWVSSFTILLPALLTAGFCASAFNVGNSALTVFMLGPERSPPFMHALNAFVGVGFMLGSLIVRPFLPEISEDTSICGQVQEQTEFNQTLSDVEVRYVPDIPSNPMFFTVPPIVWPFLIIAIIHIVTGLGFIALALVRCALPEYEKPLVKGDAEVSVKKEKLENSSLKHPYVVLLLTFIYFAISGGMEGFFVSQSYTFGICGPHTLEPSQASSLTTVYFSCFLAGRLFGIFLSSHLKPQVMILVSQGGCFLSALMLVKMAGWQLEALFIFTGTMGFFISLQFASGFSWLAKHMDMAGKISSIPSFGVNFGWLTFPPIAGVIFFSWIGPMGIYSDQGVKLS